MIRSLGVALRTRTTRLLRARAALFALAAVSGLSVAGSAIGFVFQIFLAARFGAGKAIDSYLFAISMPTFLAGLGAAAFSFTIVPALVLVEQDAAARAALLRAIRWRAGMIAFGFVACGVPAMLLQPLLLQSSSELRHSESLLVMIFLGWVVAGVQFFSTLFVIELNAARRPIWAGLLALPPNVGAILVLLLAPATIVAAPIGVLFGSLIGVAFGAGLTRRAFRRGVRLDTVSGRLHVGRIGWTLLAMSCFSSYALVDAFWGPRVASGTLASLGYAQRLVIGIGGLILAGPSAILTPRFAARLRDEGGMMFLRDVMRTTAVVASLAVCAALVLALLANPLIGAAFRRGAFQADDVARVSLVFRSMLPGFCAMLVSVVLTRAIYCLTGIERPMAMLGVGWSACYLTGCGLLLSWGGPGFGASYSIAWFAYALIATLILHRYARRAVGGADK